MWSSPSASEMPRARALISTPGISSIGAGIARPRTSSRYAAIVSWSVIASVVTPAAATSRTSSTGWRTPSDRSVWVWRSTVETPLPAPGCGRLPWRLGLISDVDQPLDALDRERPTRRRVDVDLGGVEHDRALADREPRR